jgi:hypothetical protein
VSGASTRCGSIGTRWLVIFVLDDWKFVGCVEMRGLLDEKQILRDWLVKRRRRRWLIEVVEMDRSETGAPILEGEPNLELLDSKERSILRGLFITLAGV